MTEKEFKDLEKEFCDYETSVALKELGFREKCLTYYDTEDNVGLLFNTQWTSDYLPCQFTDCLESHNSNTSDDNSYVDAPTIYQAQKWFRENMGILLDPRYLDMIDDWICVISYKNISRRSSSTNGMGGYEESLAEGIKKVIATLKDRL
jgi:hypothetical protein